MRHLKLRYPLALIVTAFSTMLLLYGIPAFAQGFPTLFGIGPVNAGTEFYLAFPANWEYQSTTKYVRLYISSAVATRVDIYALGQFKGSVTTVPNDIVTYDLSNIEAQVFVRDDNTPVPNDQIYAGQALRIVSEEPIVLYGLNRTSFTSDGMLALPVSALGQEYVVASATSVAGGTQELPSQYMIIAPYDNTQVTITNPQNTPNHQGGETSVIVLNRGDVYSAMSVGQGGDLTGAHIVADKPVAVTAGQNCTYLPTAEYPACDHLEEMLLPVESWGTHYHAVPFQNRTKGDTYRILAGEDDADVYVNGVKLATLSQVGGAAGIGWIEFRETTRRALEFSSNKRISVAQYNNSQTYDNAGGSDPFYIVLTPVEQYQEELIFTTPGDDFPNNFINIVGDSAAVANAEIASAGTNSWQTLTSLSGATYSFSTLIDGISYKGLSLSINPGVYQIRSTGPIAGYLYAGSSFDSYGYPLSVATASIGPGVDDAPPSINISQGCDGSVVGVADDNFGEDEVHSNLSTVRLQANSRNYSLTVEPFIVGVSAKVNFQIQVRNGEEDGMAILVVTDRAGNTMFDTVRYSSQALPTLSGSTNFGSIAPQTSKEIEVTLRNEEDNSLTVNQLLLSNGTTGFEIVDPKESFVLDADEERMVTIRFVGTQEGTFHDSLLFSNDCGIYTLAQVEAKVQGTTGVDGGASDKKAGGLFLSIAPNPIEGEEAVIDYRLPSKSVTIVEIFNAAGESLRRISLSETTSGSHQARIDLRGLAAGAYLCVLSNGQHQVSTVLTLLR